MSNEVFTVQDRINVAYEYLRAYQEKKYRLELELKVIESLDPDGKEPVASTSIREQISWFDTSITTIEAELATLEA